MKKKMYQNIVAMHVREHSSIYLFVIVLFLMGVIFGAVVVNSLSFNQKEDLYYYLSQFFGQVSTGKMVTSNDLFMQSLFHNSKFIGLMGLLGISIIGLPIILIFLFMKGMVVGFTVGFLVNQMGWNGFLLSFVSVSPTKFDHYSYFYCDSHIVCIHLIENDSTSIYEENDRTHFADARKICGVLYCGRYISCCRGRD